MREVIYLLERIPELTLEKSSVTAWKDWLMNFKSIMAAVFDDLSEIQKVSFLTNRLLPSYMPVFVALGVDLQQVSFDELVVTLAHYSCPMYQRVTFLRRLQRKEESFEEFARNLNSLSIPCRFDDNERLLLVRDVFLSNLHPKYAAIQKQILLQEEIPLSDCVALANKLLKGIGKLSDPTVASSKEALLSQAVLESHPNEEVPTVPPQVKTRKFTPGEVVEVDVVGLQGDTFFVWPSAFRDNRQQFLACLQREVNRENDKRTVTPEKGNKYVASFQGEWFRVTVIEINYKLVSVKVQSMDFGWAKKLHNCALRSMPLDFFGVEPLAVPIRISNPLAPGQLSCSLSFVELNDGIWSVTLSTSGGGQYCTKNLEYEKHEESFRGGRGSVQLGREVEDQGLRNGRRSTLGGSFTENRPEPKVQIDLSSFRDRSQRSGDSQRPPIAKGEFANVKITFVAPKGTVHVCLESNWTALQNMSNVISEGNLRPIQEVHNDFRCATKIDNVWCRAKIVTVDRKKGIAHVSLYDWGNEEWVPISSLMYLPADLAMTPLPLSFPIIIPSFEGLALAEGESLEVSLKEKDGGAWTIELKDSTGGEPEQCFKNHSLSQPADYNYCPDRPDPNEKGHQDEFGSNSGGFQQGNPNPNNRGPVDTFGSSTCGDSHQSEPNANVERERVDKFGATNGLSRPTGPNRGSLQENQDVFRSNGANLEIPDKKLDTNIEAPPIPQNSFTTVKVTDTSMGITVFNIEYQDDVQRFWSVLNEWYAQPTNLRAVGDLRNEDMVAAQWGDEWYRAEIVSLQDGGKKVKVKFVDWGNEDVIEISNIMILPDNLKQAPVYTFAIKVPKSMNFEAADEFKVKPKFQDADGSWVVEVEGIPDDTPPQRPAKSVSSNEAASPCDVTPPPRPTQSYSSNEPERPFDVASPPLRPAKSVSSNEPARPLDDTPPQRPAKSVGLYELARPRDVIPPQRPAKSVGSNEPARPHDVTPPQRPAKSVGSNEPARPRDVIPPQRPAKSVGSNEPARPRDVTPPQRPAKSVSSNEPARPRGVTPPQSPAKSVSSNEPARPRGVTPPQSPPKSVSSNEPARLHDVTPPLRSAQSNSSNKPYPIHSEDTRAEPSHPPPIPRGSFTDVQVMYYGPEGTFATPVDKLSVVVNILSDLIPAATSAGPGFPDVDNIIAAPYDGEIYRAKVLSADPTTAMARVSFVDFGNEQDVPFDALLALPAHFREHIHNFRFKLDPSSNHLLAEGHVLSVTPISFEPDGAWLLKVRD